MVYSKNDLWTKGPNVLLNPNEWITYKETAEWGNERVVLNNNIYQNIDLIDINIGLPNSQSLNRITNVLQSTFIVEQFMLILKRKIKVKNPYTVNDQKRMFII